LRLSEYREKISFVTVITIDKIKPLAAGIERVSELGVCLDWTLDEDEVMDANYV